MIPGLRGTGKTTVLWQLYRYLVEEKKIKLKYVLFLPVDELKTLVGGDIYEAVNCYEELLGRRLEELDRPVFLLLDEITYDPKWPSAVKAIYDRSPMVFIVVSGSSALALQMTPDLARRGIREILYPMSMAEYLMLKYNKYLQKNFIKRLKAALFETFSPEEMLEKLEILHRMLMAIDLDLRTLVSSYLKFGGLPFTMHGDEITYEQVYDVIERVINKDFAAIYKMKSETRERTAALLAGLSTHPPGPLSILSISKSLGIKYDTARKILQALEHSLILYSIPPYAKGLAQARKLRKYCFSTPVIRAALAFRLGWPPEDLLGAMLEDAVLSTLIRLKATYPKIVGVHYDPKEGGADAVVEVRTGKGTISVPLEIEWGLKDGRQVRNTMKHTSSSYGIIVDDVIKPELDKDVIHVPKYIFLLL